MVSTEEDVCDASRRTNASPYACVCSSQVPQRVDDLQNATRSGDPYYELADDLKWPANYAPTGEGQPKLQATYLSNRESGARQKIHLYLKRLMLQQKRTWKPKGT
ncbi:uncharacterized protein [Physcomitrium patens]|uniref:uncharacterized protein isoform X3 n=1 Tax=Physcomitrium patens TaxID=3218 RepID=UPI003CCDD213